MRKWGTILLLGLMLMGCSEDDVTEDVVKAEDKVDAELSEGMYYQSVTNPAIVDIWDEFDTIFDETSDVIFANGYDKEHIYEKITEMMERYNELAIQIENLPMDKLSGDLKHLENFKKNSLAANEQRLLYGEAIVAGLRGETGFIKSETERAQLALEKSVQYSSESMADVNAFEDERGYP